jgi:polysaccharide export outer membrane protein
MTKKLYVAFIAILFLTSCASRKSMVYFHGNDSASQDMNSNFEPKLKTDDLLMIVVSAQDPEAAKAFNLPIVGVTSDGSARVNASQQFQLYLVDNVGNIEFPILGTIKVGGLTKAELMAQLKQDLKKYINDPILNIRIMNYKISVTGEVAHPGNFSVTSERITLPDALALAGDMTIYGKRENVLILRDINGAKTINHVDMTKTNFVNSEFYYLTQNDVVYVEPNRTKINSSVVGPNTSFIISAISLTITVIALLIRL